MSISQRVYDSSSIKAETQYIKSYKVVINALKQELNEKERTIEQLQSMIRDGGIAGSVNVVVQKEASGFPSSIHKPRSIERSIEGREDRIKTYNTRNTNQDTNSSQKQLNRTIPMNEETDEDILRKKIEIQGKIIAEHEYTIRCLKQQNEKLKGLLNDSKILKEELTTAKQHILAISNELQDCHLYKSEENEPSHDKRNEDQLKELLMQNEYLRQEIQQLQGKLDNLAKSPRVISHLTQIGNHSKRRTMEKS